MEPLSRSARPLALALWLASATIAQIQLNTTLTTFVPVAGSVWVAGLKGYTAPNGREYVLITQGNLGISIYDITNSASPQLITQIPLRRKLVGRHVFRAKGRPLRDVLDVSDGVRFLYP